jgi:hypothetical protein
MVSPLGYVYGSCISTVSTSPSALMYLASRSIGFAIEMGKYLGTAMPMMNNLQNQRPKNREGNETKIKEREKKIILYIIIIEEHF